ncbi:ATP-binding protein [Streptomyces sp. NPDC099088]|uniref:ATP-binding protein n=1 Tax=Streptomyces sp. NPDC099088 TaxID=3366101 RepID=UPI00381F4EC8
MAICFTRRPTHPKLHACTPLIQRVPQMRRLVAARLRVCVLDGLVDPMALVTSELVTNALQHSRGESISLLLSCAATSARLIVKDGSARRPVLQAPCDAAERGRGLYLVSWTAAEYNGSWGFSDDNTQTWCTLTTPRRVPSRGHQGPCLGTDQTRSFSDGTCMTSGLTKTEL